MYVYYVFFVTKLGRHQNCTMPLLDSTVTTTFDTQNLFQKIIILPAKEEIHNIVILIVIYSKVHMI